MSETHANKSGHMPDSDVIGLHLRRARQAKKLEIDEIAGQLRLNEEIISALEDDDLDSLPAPIYTRGYIRSYAAKVGIDSDELIETYDKMLGEQSEPELPVLASVRQYKLTDYRILAITVIIAVVLLSLFVVSWMEKPEQDVIANIETAQNEISDVTSSVDNTLVTVEPEIPDSKNEIDSSSGISNVNVEAQAVQVEAEQLEAEQLEAEQQIVNTQEATSAVANAEPSTPENIANKVAQVETGTSAVNGEDDKLELAFTDNCWTEVYDDNGKRLLFLMARKGRTYSMAGKAPFKILLGNSPGVNVSINGERFDQSAYNRGKVARFFVDG